MIFPFDAINIPGNATSVVFGISVDVAEIIEQYGTGGSAKYVLRNKWWESVYMTASVE